MLHTPIGRLSGALLAPDEASGACLRAGYASADEADSTSSPPRIPPWRLRRTARSKSARSPAAMCG